MSIQPGNRMRGKALAAVLATGLSWPVPSPAWAAPVQAAAAPSSRQPRLWNGNRHRRQRPDRKGRQRYRVQGNRAGLGPRPQLPAGAKSLSAATPIKVSDIAVGDRILAKTTPDGNNYTASTVVAMKQADIAKCSRANCRIGRPGALMES